MRWLSRPANLFLLALALAILFAAIAADVMHHGALERFDHVLAKRVYEAVGEPNIWLAMLTAGWGAGRVTVPLGVLCGIGLIVLRRWRWLAFWACTLLGVAKMDGLLKALIQRPRPTEYTAFLSDQLGKGYSFPSGHTLGALVVWGALAYMLAKMYPSRRLAGWGTIAVGVIVLSVTFGLMYAGWHYLTDILGAYAAGGAWLALCIGVMEWIRTCRIKT